MAGWLVPPTEAVHVSFGSVLGDDRKMLRSRTGDSVKLIDCSTRRSNERPRRSPRRTRTSTTTQRAELARTIGIGAVKYADLSTDRVKDYVFDWDRMLSFDGNTAPSSSTRTPDLLDLPPWASNGRPLVSARSRSTPRRSGRSRCGCWPTRPRSTPRSRPTARTSSAPTSTTGDGLHRVLRALPDPQGGRAAAFEPVGPRRPDRPRAGAQPRPARHRRPGTDVSWR